MATINEPKSTSRAIAVRWGQPLRFEADVSTNWWWKRNADPNWTQINSAATATIVWAPPGLERRFTFDAVTVLAQTLSPSGGVTGDTRTLDVCDGPAATLVASASLPDARGMTPPLRPDDSVSDDVPLAVPFATPGANRDGLGSARLESAPPGSGPANLTAVLGPGVFVDTAGRIAFRVPIASVQGLAPLPVVTSIQHPASYFVHDFGTSRSLSVTRVLYEDSVGNVAVVRGDGRRNTYRTAGGGAFNSATSIENTLAKSGTTFRETTPDGTQYYFTVDPNLTGRSRLNQVVDRNGNTAYYRYYGSTERLQKIEGVPGAQGLTPYFVYDGAGLLSNLTLFDESVTAAHRTAYFEYDGTTKVLTKIIGPELCNTYFTYGTGTAPSPPTDHVVRLDDSEGFSWVFYYEQDGTTAWRSRRIVDPRGGSTLFYFNLDLASDPLTTWQDRSGKTTYFKYNAFGSPTAVFNVGTPGDYYSYDGRGFLLTAQNRTTAPTYWRYERDDRLNRISSTDPLLARRYFAYDTSNELRFVVDPVGRFTYLEYDANRNLTKRQDPIGNTTYHAFQSTGLRWFTKDRRGSFTYFGFDAKGNLASVHDALGFGTYFDYDAAGERTATVDALGQKTYFSYDKRGRLQFQKDAYNGFRYFVYDGRCNVVTRTDERGLPTYHAYDGNSNLYFTMDAVGNKTYFGYDAEDRSSTVKDARGNVTTTAYDVLGRRQKVTDASGFVQYWGYDDAHELTVTLDGRTPPNATYFDYDRAARLAHRKDAKLNSTYMGYDASGAQTLSLDEIGVPTYFSFDGAARRQSVLESAQLYSYFAYDAEDNLVLTNVDQGWGRQPWGTSPYGGERATSYFRYDVLNRRTHATDTYGSVTYTGYDKVPNVAVQVNERGVGTYFFYDLLNRRIQTKDGVHFAITYTGYDAASNVTLQLDSLGKPCPFGTRAFRTCGDGMSRRGWL